MRRNIKKKMQSFSHFVEKTLDFKKNSNFTKKRNEKHHTFNVSNMFGNVVLQKIRQSSSN